MIGMFNWAWCFIGEVWICGMESGVARIGAILGFVDVHGVDAEHTIRVELDLLSCRVLYIGGEDASPNDLRSESGF